MSQQSNEVVPVQSNELTTAQRLDALNTECEELKTKQISARTELEMLKSQRAAKLEELKALGVSLPSDIPATIAEYEQQIEQLLATGYAQLQDIKEKLGLV